MENLPLLVLDLSYQHKCLLAQQGRPLSHIIININQINYLLHLLLITLRWGRPVPFTLQLG